MAWLVFVEDDDSTAKEFLGPFRVRSTAQAFAELVEARLDSDGGLRHVTVEEIRSGTLKYLRDQGWFD